MIAPSRVRFAACAGSLVVFTTVESAAQTNSLDQRYSEGFSIQRLEPAPAGDRFFAVPDATTSGAPEPLRATLLVHETLAPSIERTDNDTGATREIVSNRLTAHLAGAFRATSWFDTSVDVPIVLVQKGEGPAAPESPAFGDLRLSNRARVVGSERATFSFAAALDVWLPTGSERRLTGDGSLRMQPKALASGRTGPFLYATKLGLSLREHTDAGAAETGTSLDFGAAFGLAALDARLTFGAELYGSALLVSARDAAFATASSPLEALFGVRGRFGDVTLGTAAGIGLSEAPGVVPRLLAMIAYAPATTATTARAPSRAAPPPVAPEREPEPVPPPAPLAAPPPPEPASDDEDEDGVLNAADACPRDAASLAPGSPENGCPGMGPAEAIFAGYRHGAAGHATVFVELSDSVKVVFEKTAGGASYLVLGTRVATRNNENPLLAMDFASNVRSARLAAEKDAVRLLVEFRTDVTPSHRVVRRGRGATLEVDIPPK
jgi:OOP family OmpA-OmpF porin